MSKSNGLVPLFGYGAVCKECNCTEEIQPTADNGPVAEADAISYLVSSGWHVTHEGVWCCGDCWANRWELAEQRTTGHAVKFGGVGGSNLWLKAYPEWAQPGLAKFLPAPVLTGLWQLREVDGVRWLVEVKPDKQPLVLDALPF